MSEVTPSPTVRQSHRERIYDLLAGRIQRGEISSDDRLVDTALAQELGVSRMPVRDALLRLVHEGYLQSTTRGFTLPVLSQQELDEIFEMRRLLEPRAAGLAARAMDDELLVEMELALADAEFAVANDDGPALYSASVRFRNGWISAIPNLTLMEMIQRYTVQIHMVRMATFRLPDARLAVLQGHRDMMKAFRARDGLAASDRMLRFVLEGHHYFNIVSEKARS